MATIFCRSPFTVSAIGENTDTFLLELIMYNETEALEILLPAPQITMTKSVPHPSQTEVRFSVAPHLLERVSNIKFIEDSTIGVMDENEYTKARIKVTKTTAGAEWIEYFQYFDVMNGWTPREDGLNIIKNESYAMLDDGTYYTKNDSCGSVYFDTVNDGEDYLVEYRNIKTGALIYSETVAGLKKLKIPYVWSTAFAQGGNRLTIANESDPNIIIADYTFITECPVKYTPVNCDFVNRYGAWQRIMFFGQKRTSIVGSGKERAFMTSYNSAVSQPKIKKEDLDAHEFYELNTGLVGENYKTAIQDLLLSETVLLDDLPVLVATKGLELPSHENVKQINYRIKFKQAHSIVNFT